MKRQKIAEIYKTEKDKFDSNKSSVESSIEYEKHSKDEYFEILPFSFQRQGFKKGELIENYYALKDKNGTYLYGFNSDDRIIEIKEGISLENQFIYQFFFYENGIMKSLSYNHDKALQNVRYTFFNEEGRVINMMSHGRRGGKEEIYNYSNNGLLTSILRKQFDRSGTEVDSITHIFDYYNNGDLKTISEVFRDTSSQVIYRS